MPERDFDAVDFFRARPLYQDPYPYYEYLRAHGPTARAFTFRHPFPPQGSDDVVETDERWNCRA